ncbi:hypothetical protein KIPB_013205, partial [Kipferlia bialata]
TTYQPTSTAATWDVADEDTWISDQST